MTTTVAELMEFYRQLPKVELHAHINGSIGPSLLQRLVEEFGEKHRDETSDNYDLMFRKLTSSQSELMTLDECFQAFTCIHRVSGEENAV